MGTRIAHIAAAFLERNFLAIEVHTAGVSALLKTIGETGLQNIRVVQHDAVDVSRRSYLLSRPVAKKTSSQALFVSLLASKLKPNGYLHVATEREEYAQLILSVLSAEPTLTNVADGSVTHQAYRPQTKFEARGLRLGHGVWDIVFRKR